MKTLIQLALLLFTTATSFAQLEWESRKPIRNYYFVNHHKLAL
jgi:hypothetical protein